jgi:hypothetical protein
MAITLVATAGASNANTYITLADAETYFESRLHKADWDSASDGDKNIALAWATRLLDSQVEWAGAKYTESQSLRWPRSSVYTSDGEDVDYDSIPTFIANATAEYAYWLIKKDRTADDSTRGFKKLKADVLEMEVNPYDRPDVIPDAVWLLIQGYAVKKSGRNGPFADVVRV